MADFKVLRTNHTSFTVSNLERSLSIFCEGLNFKLVSKAPRDPDIISQVTGLAVADIVVAYLVGHGIKRLHLAPVALVYFEPNILIPLDSLCKIPFFSDNVILRVAALSLEIPHILYRMSPYWPGVKSFETYLPVAIIWMCYKAILEFLPHVLAILVYVIQPIKMI